MWREQQPIPLQTSLFESLSTWQILEKVNKTFEILVFSSDSKWLWFSRRLEVLDLDLSSGYLTEVFLFWSLGTCCLWLEIPRTIEYSSTPFKFSCTCCSAWVISVSLVDKKTCETIAHQTILANWSHSNTMKSSSVVWLSTYRRSRWNQTKLHKTFKFLSFSLFLIQ
jgi:hypothetical protein